MGRVWKCLEGFSQKVAQPPFGHEGFLSRYVNPEWFLIHPFGSLGNVVAKVIQTAVWPQALFGVEIGALGKDHFRMLRHQAAQAIVHHTQVGVAAIVTHLSNPLLVDPECYAITQAVRAARRFLIRSKQEDKDAFIMCCTEASGRSLSVRGPAAALKNYLLRIGWNLDKHGFLLTATELKLHICDAPWKTIKRTIEQDWLRDLIPMYSERKNLRGAPLPHREMTVKLIAKCPAKEQRGIVREIGNAYQLETQKSKWTNDSDGLCTFCMQLDSKSHRHYQCHATASVWEQYPSLCKELEELDDIHVELPVIFQPPEMDFILFCHHQNNPPVIIPEVQMIIQEQLDSGNIPTFYSDGSCFKPETPAARLAAWGLVLSRDVNDWDRKQALAHSTSVEAVSRHFLVVATGRCHGDQSIDRAELQSMVFLHEQFPCTRLVTDSQYTIDCWRRILDLSDERSLNFMANSDLLQRLYRANKGARHEVRKVKSHTWELGRSDVCQDYDTLGNEVADRVAKAANTSLNKPLVDEWQRVQVQIDHDLAMRKQHYEMLGKLHQCQTTLVDQREQINNGTNFFMGRLGNSIYDVFAEYQPQSFFQRGLLGTWSKSGWTMDE